VILKNQKETQFTLNVTSSGKSKPAPMWGLCGLGLGWTRIRHQLVEREMTQGSRLELGLDSAEITSPASASSTIDQGKVPRWPVQILQPGFIQRTRQVEWRFNGEDSRRLGFGCDLGSVKSVRKMGDSNGVKMVEIG